MKTYWVQFGSSLVTGLAPTFIEFYNQLGLTLLPPGLTQPFGGKYSFNYSVGYSTSIAFRIDGATTLLGTARYVDGVLDPVDTIDLVLGYTSSSIGSTSVDPGDIFGAIKRRQEFQEGPQNFIKSSGVWNVFSRGSSTLLVQKTLTNNTTGVTAL